MLGIRLSRQHLIKAVSRCIYNTLGCGKYLHSFIECRTHTHHIGSDLEYDRRLLTVGRTAVNLGSFLTVTAGQKQSHSGGKLRFSHLLWNFNIGGIKLPIAVRFKRSEYVTDNLFLPVNEFKRFTRPCTLCVAQALNKHNRVICCILIVNRCLFLEFSRLVFFQFSQNLTSAHEKQPPFKRLPVIYFVLHISVNGF